MSFYANKDDLGAIALGARNSRHCLQIVVHGRNYLRNLNFLSSFSILPRFWKRDYMRGLDLVRGRIFLGVIWW